jgi:translation elongation factor EF-Tu-like GTPase
MKLVEFRAQVRLKKTDEGGRMTGIKPRVYRPRLRVNGTTAECQIAEIDNGALEPGEEGECLVQAIDMNGLAILLDRNVEFELLEGVRVVATGRILQRAVLVD